MVTDTVADLIIRIKNAYLARHEEVVMPATKLRESILVVLMDLGYVSAFEREAAKPQDTLKITLRYVDGKPALTNVKRISKPGRRWYAPVDKLPRVLGGYGASIISTSKGILTDRKARELGVGGEVLFTIW